MPDKPPDGRVNVTENDKLSLERAFAVFIEQSEKLEKSHAELQKKLSEAQLDLEIKNKQLAQKINEIERIKEKLSGTIEAITDAVFLIDSEGKLESANKAALEFLKIVETDDGNIFAIKELAEYINTAVPVTDIDIEVRTTEELKYFMLSVVPVKHDDSKFNYKVISLKDITEKKNLQKKVTRETKMSALGKVAASVAHEIRNPLGAVEGFAMLLQRDLKENPSALRIASKVTYATRQVNAVVSNLLNYTRELKPSLEISDINILIRETLDFIKPMADDKKIQLNLELKEGAIYVKVDPVQFRQLITNITVNSTDACMGVKNGAISVVSDIEGNKAVIVIKDNGPGIPEKVKKQIFEPFFTMKEGGIGLGLSLCQKIVESHDGEILEVGEEGRGAEFVIRLNIAEV